MGIPSAPNSTGGTTKGLKLEANMTLGVVAALSLSPIGQSFSGNYRLHFDMWINANGLFPAGGNGSTEGLTAGVGTAGNRVEWNGSGTTADGVWFLVDGEGGAGLNAPWVISTPSSARRCKPPTPVFMRPAPAPPRGPTSTRII